MSDERMEGEDERGATRARGALWSMAAALVICPLLVVGYGLTLQRPVGQKLLAAETQPTPVPLFSEPVLVALNEVAQKRFSVVPPDSTFGITRLESVEPITDAEKTVLSDLEKSPLSVVFYTAGRRALRVAPDQTSNGRFIQMNGPVKLGSEVKARNRGHREYKNWGALTAGKTVPADAPKAQEISRHLSGMLENARVEAQHWKSGRWEMVAVPIPASSPACISCHKLFVQPRNAKTQTDFPDLQLGDTIGLAVYAYAPKTQDK